MVQAAGDHFYANNFHNRLSEHEFVEKVTVMVFDQFFKREQYFNNHIHRPDVPVPADNHVISQMGPEHASMGTNAFGQGPSEVMSTPVPGVSATHTRHDVHPIAYSRPPPTVMNHLLKTYTAPADIEHKRAAVQTQQQEIIADRARIKARQRQDRKNEMKKKRRREKREHANAAPTEEKSPMLARRSSLHGEHRHTVAAPV
ncbi:hypothetical protein MNV49_007445 [Pseudohyphozyma bogoriensis]|nr:hypothetical protein MNV49_007445 [Pseudohyphozyma bogoriensis]